jgi:hypothetical protein
MSLSVAWQSRSQCISALYSYEIATSRPGLVPVSLLNDIFLCNINPQKNANDFLIRVLV